jgi:hypothetical protein
VGQLVGQHSFELHPGQLLEEPPRHHDRSVGGVAAGGEAVRGVVLDHIEVGLGQPGGDAQAFHEVVIPGLLVGRDGLGTAERQHDPVGEKVGDDRED